MIRIVFKKATKLLTPMKENFLIKSIISSKPIFNISNMEVNDLFNLKKSINAADSIEEILNIGGDNNFDYRSAPIILKKIGSLSRANTSYHKIRKSDLTEELVEMVKNNIEDYRFLGNFLILKFESNYN